MSIRAICLCVLMGMNSLVLGSELKAIDLSQHSQDSSILFSIAGNVTPTVFALSHPDRLVVDFTQTTMSPKVQTAQLAKNNIKAVRSASYSKPNKLRLVFEVKTPFTFNKKTWQPKDRHLQGLAIDLIPKQQAKTEHAQIHQNKAIKVRHSPPNKLRDVVVVIDAGHGGKDPGARGPGGSKEKQVVLSIAVKLKQLIDKQPGMRATLTRKGDYYIGLRQRLNLARKDAGDIFVAIHADAFINHNSSGASVFALSQTGATSEAARWIAEKENYSELGGVDLSDLDDKNGVVRSVLIDLSQTATIGASLEMGQQVLGQLDKITTLHHNKVEQARFMVLKSPDIPSILVETGFISNPREEKNLNNAAYQLKLSQAIFQGLKQYFWSYPPQGSHIEAMTEKQRHIVEAYESLPSIAAKYNIKLSKLCSENHLSEHYILKKGQKLIIPSTWA